MYVNEDLADDPFNQMAQAFSHFTFERSYGHLLVNALQGQGHLLTNPSIQTKDPDRFKLSVTNLHEVGFKFFFAVHRCNSYCARLMLMSERGMVLTGAWQFRERWPKMEPTVNCSNMLCRSIVRLSNTFQSADYPDYNWCETCVVQLDAFTEDWICSAPGPDHRFRVSRFFHESQGTRPPRRCPDHREKDATKTSAASMGSRMWSKIKGTTSRRGGEISGKSW